MIKIPLFGKKILYRNRAQMTKLLIPNSITDNLLLFKILLPSMTILAVTLQIFLSHNYRFSNLHSTAAHASCPDPVREFSAPSQAVHVVSGLQICMPSISDRWLIHHRQCQELGIQITLQWCHMSIMLSQVTSNSIVCSTACNKKKIKALDLQMDHQWLVTCIDISMAWSHDVLMILDSDIWTNSYRFDKNKRLTIWIPNINEKM